MTELPEQAKQSSQNLSRGRTSSSPAQRSAGHRTDADSAVRSPLDIPGVDLDLTADEIVDLVRESRIRHD